MFISVYNLTGRSCGSRWTDDIACPMSLTSRSTLDTGHLWGEGASDSLTLHSYLSGLFIFLSPSLLPFLAFFPHFLATPLPFVSFLSYSIFIRKIHLIVFEELLCVNEEQQQESPAAPQLAPLPKEYRICHFAFTLF